MNNQQELQCVICLELPRVTVSCTICRKLFCETHLRRLAANKCPHCRATPFKTRSEPVLQKQIDNIRKTRNKNLQSASCFRQNTFKCRVSGCFYQGYYLDVVQHAMVCHDGLELHKIVYHLETDDGLYIPSNIAVTTGIVACQNPGYPLPKGHNCKVPKLAVALKMLRHISSCKLRKDCQNLWYGAWGAFIGGSKGGDCFDLSVCPQAKRINQSVGWDYCDPYF